MKVTKLKEHSAGYPKKSAVVKIGAAAAAALLAVSTSACGPQVSGYLVNETPEPTQSVTEWREYLGAPIVDASEEPAPLGDVEIDPSVP